MHREFLLLISVIIILSCSDKEVKRSVSNDEAIKAELLLQNDTLYVTYNRDSCYSFFPIFSKTWLDEKNIILNGENICSDYYLPNSYRVNILNSFEVFNQKYYTISYESGRKLSNAKSIVTQDDFMTRILVVSEDYNVSKIHELRPINNKERLIWDIPK